MPEFPETRESLFVRLRDVSDRESWAEFVYIYRPIIYRMVRRRGIQDADAQDLVQKVLLSIAGSIQDWVPDRERARFRTWLNRVVTNAIIDTIRRVQPDAAAGGTSMYSNLEAQPAPDALQQELSREYQREVFRRAARQVRPQFEDTTWNAFWKTTVENIPAATVARELHKTVGAVYTARSRVMQRLRDAVSEFEHQSWPAE